MRKFYLPTSTLNFNNILSTESISPKAFYEQREFGYSRWVSIPENPLQNVIILYESICYFERPKSDIEDHPLLIEIEIDESNLKRNGSCWFCDHTLYLTPTTSRFLFFSEQDQLITLSMSESSSETKLLPLYHRCIETVKPTRVYQPTPIEEPCKLNELEIEKDIRVNKMKGMLYGYYIGALLSTDSESVKYLNALREIHNVFAAIYASFNRQPTQYQDQRLDELFDIINTRNATFEEFNNIVDDSEKTKRILKLLMQKYGMSFDVEDKNVYLYYLQGNNESQGDRNYSIKWIENRIEQERNRISSKATLLHPDQGKIIVIGNSVSSLQNENVTDELENKLCVAWLNETLSSKETNGKISTYKEELAKNITLKARDVYQECWEHSSARIYLNDLRKHIAGDEFSHCWNNGLLPSVAAVIIAGDDWEKLLSFMQGKGIADYKLAFAFFGELNGFANLTRDFTELLFNQDKNYVWEVYKEFHGQLHGESLNNSGKMNVAMPVPKTIEKQIETSIDENREIILKLKESKIKKADEIVALYQKWRENPTIFLREVGKLHGIGEKSMNKITDVLNITQPAKLESFDDDLIIQLDCSKGLDSEKKEQLVYWWKVAHKKYPKNKRECIHYFINLCKKEGRGESSSFYQGLKGYFTQEIADQFELELNSKYK